MITHEDFLRPHQRLHGKQSDYVIEQIIGRGGMGAVYRVKRLSDQTTWAIKEMRPFSNTPPEEIEENTRLFKQEIDLMSSLNHPNLLTIAESFEHEGRPVMVMEFVPGRTLEDHIRDMNAPMLEQQVISYGIQLCRVLHYLHTREPPIIYRDLKPPNIMITPNGVMKLIDFGVARTFKARKSKDTIAMGSAGYAPPEQYGRGQTDARSDLYALGATLLHLLTGLPPVPLQQPSREKIHEINPSVSQTTINVIVKSMSLDRSQRYRNAMEMEQSLHGCLTTPYVDPTTLLPPSTSVHVPASPPPKVLPVAPPPPPPRPPRVRAAPPPPPTSPPALAPPALVVPTAPSPASASPVAPTMEPGSIACSGCGYINKPGARFCANCGTPVGSQSVARLLVTSSRGTWQTKLEQTPFRIGRRDPRRNHHPELDLAEHDKGIASRNHAHIDRDGAYYLLTDLGSTNGTFLNGIRMRAHTPQRLRPGDRIKIGEVEMEFLWS